MPRIRAGIEVEAQVKKPQTARMRLAIARPDVLAVVSGTASDLTLFILRPPKK